MAPESGRGSACVEPQSFIGSSDPQQRRTAYERNEGGKPEKKNRGAAAGSTINHSMNVTRRSEFLDRDTILASVLGYFVWQSTLPCQVHAVYLCPEHNPALMCARPCCSGTEDSKPAGDVLRLRDNKE